MSPALPLSSSSWTRSSLLTLPLTSASLCNDYFVVWADSATRRKCVGRTPARGEMWSGHIPPPGVRREQSARRFLIGPCQMLVWLVTCAKQLPPWLVSKPPGCMYIFSFYRGAQAEAPVSFKLKINLTKSSSEPYVLFGSAPQTDQWRGGVVYMRQGHRRWSLACSFGPKTPIHITMEQLCAYAQNTARLWTP